MTELITGGAGPETQKLHSHLEPPSWGLTQILPADLWYP